MFTCMSKKRDGRSASNIQSNAQPPQQRPGPRQQQQPPAATATKRPLKKLDKNGKLITQQSSNHLEDPTAPAVRGSQTARQNSSQFSLEHHQSGATPPELGQIGRGRDSSMGKLFMGSGVSKRTFGESQVSSDADGLRIDTQFTEHSESRQRRIEEQNLEKYLKFVKQELREPRFQKEELEELKRAYDRASVRQKIIVPDAKGNNQEVSAKVMNKEQFRSQMGLLGQQGHPFLADRMFEVFDVNRENYLNFKQFTAIMDILCNGEEYEKNQFSFALMDRLANGYISFPEFHDYFTQVISHWSSLVNSHVRVNRQEIYQIFKQIDINNDESISFHEYRRALKKNPELLDWFELLNSAKTKGGEPSAAASARVSQIDEAEVKEAALKQAQLEEEEKNKDIVKIDKDKVEKIVQLKDIHERKGTKVQKLKRQVTEMHGQTEEQLQAIMRQIEMLTGQVQKQLSRREEEKKLWEESVLQQQQQDMTMSQYDPAMSQVAGSIFPTQSNLGGGPSPDHLGQPTREQQLYAQLIDDEDDDGGMMPFMESADATKFEREESDEFNRATRQPAMTFGIKTNARQQHPQQHADQYGGNPHNRILHQQQAIQQHDISPPNGFTAGGSGEHRGSSGNNKEYDSNATLQQWQQKGLLQKTNNGSNSPTGQSSNFHFSQFNYEFTSRNPSMKIEESSNVVRRQQHTNFQFDDRHLRTDDNQFDMAERAAGNEEMIKYGNSAQFKTTKLQKVAAQRPDDVAEQFSVMSLPLNPTKSPQQVDMIGQPVNDENNQTKTYEEILGPSASLNDILNFDFAGRYANKYKPLEQPQAPSPQKPQQQQPMTIETSQRPSEKSISPIFEVLIKLRQGREQAKETVGEKHIQMAQVPSKQKQQNSTIDTHNQVSQKIIDDPDADDIILDPESPINSATPSPLSGMSGGNNANPSNLKVNMRHQKRQEMRKNNNTNTQRSFDAQSAVSSNLNKLSQMQGGVATVTNFGGGQQASQLEQHLPHHPHPYHQQLAGTQPVFPSQMLAQSMTSQAGSDLMQPGFQPGPHAFTAKKDQLAERVQYFGGVASSRDENEPFSNNRIGPLAHQQSVTDPPSPVLVNHNLWAGGSNERTRSAWMNYEESKGNSHINANHRLETHSQSQQYSQILVPQHQGPKSNRTQLFTAQPAPPSPRAEKEMLSKLDEVGSTVNNWLKQLEQNKARLVSKKQSMGNTNKGLRSKSANCRTSILSSDGDKAEDGGQKADKHNSSGAGSSSNPEDYDEHLNVIDEIKQLAEQKKKQDILKQQRMMSEPAQAQQQMQMIDTTGASAANNADANPGGRAGGKQNLAVTFQSARRADMIVSSKHSRHSTNSPTEQHGRDSNLSKHTNTHQALAKPKKKNKSKKDKTFIHFGNDNWNLVLHMLFGIRQSVHSVMYDDVYQLTDAEFQSKFRYELEAMENQKIWNLKKYEFYDFSPRMFNLIRKFYGINSHEYLKSIGPETLFGSLNMGHINSLKSQCSAGKSGSLFYYTSDGLYMLKTISHDEFEHFKAIMKNYYHHMLAYPHTMITRFYGLHKIKFTRTTRIERVYFVIMANVFNTQQNINVRYDLKGSTYGRLTRKKKDEVISSATCLKDQDWLMDKRIINLQSNQRELIAQQLKADTKFFQDNNINDYSVLLGIAKLKGGHREAESIVRASDDFQALYADGILSRIVEETKRKEAKRTQSTLLQSVKTAGPGGFLEIESMYNDAYSKTGGNNQMRVQSVAQPLQRNESELLLHERSRPQKAFFESQDGGLVSADGTEIYFMGIIDILTNFGKKKRMENMIRSIVHNSRTISCIPPQQYGDRFYRFMTEKVYLTKEQLEAEIRAREQNEPSPVFDSKDTKELLKK